MAQHPAPASGPASNENLPTLLLTAGLTIVAALLLPQIGLDDQLTGALAPVIGGIPAAIRVSAQRRSVTASPGLVVALL